MPRAKKKTEEEIAAFNKERDWWVDSMLYAAHINRMSEVALLMCAEVVNEHYKVSKPEIGSYLGLGEDGLRTKLRQLEANNLVFKYPCELESYETAGALAAAAEREAAAKTKSKKKLQSVVKQWQENPFENRMIWMNRARKSTERAMMDLRSQLRSALQRGVPQSTSDQ